MSQIFLFIAIGLAVVAVALFWIGIAAVRRRQWVGSVGGAGSGALFLALAALSTTLGVSTQGYRALTHEEVAVTVTTISTGPQQFQAFLEFPDGRGWSMEVAGDQLMVDAHILKWHPLANFLGVHTHYELDRLTGRYIELEDERSRPRTVHSLKGEKPADLFHLARRYTLLAFLVDTEYGSATFITVDRPARFEIRVSTTGLLVREVEL